MAHFGRQFRGPFYLVGNFSVGIQIGAADRAYGVDTGRVRQMRVREAVRVVAEGFCLGEGADKAEGRAVLEAHPTPHSVRMSLRVEHVKPIQWAKLILRGLPMGKAIGPDGQAIPLSPAGVLLKCPSRELPSPLLFIHLVSGAWLYFRSSDAHQMDLTFSVQRVEESLWVELARQVAAEQAATYLEGPQWHVGVTRDRDGVLAEHKSQAQ